jgi:uroporphyrin-III C-methyltransferase
MKKPIDRKGKVIIAGAGPGDPELLTLKALRWLKEAEVIITDRLVSEVILSEFAGKNAQVLHVGKQCGRPGSTPQEIINELLVEYALQGKLVVRLKGGDVSFFSNVLDELTVLVRHQIPYEIIPGVTAASGAAAYAGIPLTARNFARAVRFITCHPSDLANENYWDDLARSEDTLVFYMSSDHVGTIVKNLIASGISRETHIAVIEQATTPLQQVHCSSVYGFFKKNKPGPYASPTLVIIGKVVALHDQFRWLPNSRVPLNYFSPVSEKSRAATRA